MRRSLTPGFMLLTLALAACSASSPAQLGLSGAAPPQPPQPGPESQLGTPGLNVHGSAPPSLVPRPITGGTPESY